MPLNQDILGQELYAVRNSYSNMNPQELANVYGSLEDARLHQAKAEAAVIINHFINNIALTIPGTGLAAPNGPVTGAAVTGTIQ